MIWRDKFRKKFLEYMNNDSEPFLREGEIIRAEGLTKCFGDFVAVDHISFYVKKGEIFGFLGANGAGKTTAMKMLCGLSKPTDGRAMVAGYDLKWEVKNIKRSIGYMSQKFSLYEDLKVWENIRLFGGIYGMSNVSCGRIVRSLSGFYDVQTPQGVVTCRGRGHLRKAQETPLVGDMVEIPGVKMAATVLRVNGDGTLECLYSLDVKAPLCLVEVK